MAKTDTQFLQWFSESPCWVSKSWHSALLTRDQILKYYTDIFLNFSYFLIRCMRLYPTSVVSDSLQTYEPQLTRVLCQWESPGKNTGVGYCALLQEIFVTQGSNPLLLCLLHWSVCSLYLNQMFSLNLQILVFFFFLMLLLLLSCFSCVRLCATPETAAHQAPTSLGFSRQEHCSGLLFPSPMYESEK